MRNKQNARARRFILPLIILLLPFFLFGPYCWIVYSSSASPRIVTPRLEESHRRAHLGSFVTLTFGPFAIICVVTSVALFIRRLKREQVPAVAEKQNEDIA